jgi:Quercetinase C-terminal cupin domain
LTAGDGAAIDIESEVKIEANRTAELLLFDFA